MQNRYFKTANIKKLSLPTIFCFFIIFSMILIYSCELIGFTSQTKIIDVQFAVPEFSKKYFLTIH